jgi:hypothetical protein
MILFVTIIFANVITNIFIMISDPLLKVLFAWEPNKIISLRRIGSAGQDG